MNRRRKPAATRRVPAGKRPRSRREARPAAADDEAREEVEVPPAEQPGDVQAEVLPAVEAEELPGGDGEPLPGPAEAPGPKALPAPRRDRELQGGLVRYDPLRAYMAEVARHPVLSREEEHQLAVRYSQTGDVQAAYRLVASNLRLVVKIAHEYRRAAFQVLDLVQEGNIGLMQAVQKYDPFRGVKLSTYAAWWIRAYIIRFLMDNWRLVKLGTTQAQRKLFFNLSKEREKLLARGIEPTPRLLAKNLRVEEKDVEEMSMRMGSDDLSLDAPARGDEDSAESRLDRLSAAAPAADEQIGDEELRRVFREKLMAFAGTITDERERAIFQERLLPPEGVEPRTLQEIGGRFNLTRERARQIEAKLTARLREYLQAEIPDFELLGPPE
jgi:RNA polymerase sigma-32 factor